MLKRISAILLATMLLTSCSHYSHHKKACSDKQCSTKKDGKKCSGQCHADKENKEEEKKQ